MIAWVQDNVTARILMFTGYGRRLWGFLWRDRMARGAYWRVVRVRGWRTALLDRVGGDRQHVTWLFWFDDWREKFDEWWSD